MLLLQGLLIYTRDFHGWLQRVNPPSPTTYLLSSPPSPSSLHFCLCPLGSLPSLVPACLKTTTAGGKYSPSTRQLAIAPEKLANENTADEREKWDKLLFINTQRGERFVCVSVCVFLRGVLKANNCLIYISQKTP